MLAFGTQHRGFEAGFFHGEKILSTPSFGREVKPSVPCRRFAACKRSLKEAWKPLFSAKICRPFLATGASSVVVTGDTPGGAGSQ